MAELSADLQALLDRVAEGAARSCGADDVVISLVEGDHFRRLAHTGPLPQSDIAPSLPLDADANFSSKAMLDRTVVQIENVQTVQSRTAGQGSRAAGARTVVWAPLVVDDRAIGTVSLRRVEVRLFSEAEIGLIQSFAEMAALAIENGRLKAESEERNAALRESLERQTAMSEVLSVIASAPTDLDPVFNAIAERANRLCGGTDAVVTRRVDGEYRLAAHAGPHETLPVGSPVPVVRSVLERLTRHEFSDAETDPEWATMSALAQRFGYRMALGAPLRREDEALGVIVILRTDSKPFSDPEAALLETFANQAVIAIENARLFDELEQKTREQAETLEEQAATNHILEMISQSPTDVQPVLDAIVEEAGRLCAASGAGLCLAEADEMVGPAVWNAGHSDGGMPRGFRMPILWDSPVGRAYLTREVLAFDDIATVPEEEFPRSAQRSREWGHHSVIYVPLHREGVSIGVLIVTRQEIRPFSPRQIDLLKSFADQAVIAIENVRLFHELEERNAALREALEQQAATAEVLNIIASSPTELQPVLDAICENAARVCGANDANIRLLEGNDLALAAGYGSLQPHARLVSVDMPGTGPRAFRERRPIRVADAQAGDPNIPESMHEALRGMARQGGYRAVLAAPLQREGEPIGVIQVRRAEAGLFSDAEEQLLETFANQAVIAIENVRLFNDLRESLEQQTAMSEVLEIIASSPTNVQPVLDAICASAARVCGAPNVSMRLLQGDELEIVAFHGPPELNDLGLRLQVGPGSTSGRALLEGRTIYVPDRDEQGDFPGLGREGYRARGMRSFVTTPLVREGVGVGTIVMEAAEPNAFADKQIQLLETLADQAVIAIENVRLFHELEERNSALREALEHQTATAEVLGIISRSPTDVQPVLDAICHSATRVFRADNVALFRVEDGALRMVALEGVAPYAVGSVIPLSRETGGAGVTAVLNDRTIHIPDIFGEVDPRFARTAELSRQIGTHTVLSTPMRRQGAPVGAIVATRQEQRAFTPAEIKLLETFADQAIIAMENARLFDELQQKTREQAETLEEQAATNHILEIISQSPTDVQPVLDAIVENAAQVCQVEDVALRLIEGDRFILRANAGSMNPGPPVVAADASDLTFRWVLEHGSLHLPDLQGQDQFLELRANRPDTRTILLVPLRRQGQMVGAFNIRRKEVRPFTNRQISLIETFADQAVIAIENVRLFHELEERNAALREALEHQTATAEVLSIISRSPTDVQPVLDAICESAARVCAIDDISLFLVEGELATGRAHFGEIPSWDEPVPIRPGGAAYRTIRLGESVHYADAQVEASELGQRMALEGGYHTLLMVPLRSEAGGIGVLQARRLDVRPFTEPHVRLIQTFADQAVIAIENARLFDELQQKTQEQAATLEEQAATNRILEIISQSPTDVQPVLDAIVEEAARVCDVEDVGLRLADRDELVLRAHAGPMIPGVPTVPKENTELRIFQERRTVHILDLKSQEEFADIRANRPDTRSMLLVALRHLGEFSGFLALHRSEVLPFTERQIKLIETFADQAVIAIENVRLFHELEERNAALHEALDYQTATAEVLSIISRSPTDVQPVLDAIVESAAKVVGADDVVLRLVEGNLAIPKAHFGPLPIGSPAIDMDTPEGQWMQEHVMHIPDVLDAHALDSFPATARNNFRTTNLRTFLAVPLRHEGRMVGAFSLRRTEVRPFTDAQIKLLETFADQAVIALENVRLFDELEARNRDLMESVAQQAATAEVLEVMSAAPEQLQLVLDAVAERATQVCNATDATIYIERDGVLRHAARFGSGAAGLEEIPLDASRVSGQAFAEQRVVHVPDALAQIQYSAIRQAAEQGGARGYLAVPLIHEGRAQGVILGRRLEPEPFTDRQIELLKTFADQGAIAITLSRLIEEIRDKNQQLEVASHHKSEFLANMSHELRTPLNAIIGFSEVLAEQIFGELNEKQADYINDIVSSGRHLLSLINDILDLSKIEAGQMELELTEFSLPEALDNGLTMVKERAARHGIVLSLNVDPDLATITADERKIKQVLFNLLSNAVKFTPDGGRVTLRANLTLSLVAGEAEGARPHPNPLPEGEGIVSSPPLAGEGQGEGVFAQISVIDTGIGIAPEDQERIFEEFQQARESATSATAEGTGLGLTLARRFVELHGGRIWVESHVGVGSTFTFTVPVAQVRSGSALIPSPLAGEGEGEGAHALTQADRPAPSPRTGEGGEHTILLIEDDERAANLFSLFLREAGFEVAVARDGAAGLDLARELRPICIVLDVILPTVDGWEVISRARSDPQLTEIPIVVATVIDERARGLALGARDYLVKPVSRDALLSAVQRVVGSRAPAT